MGLNISLYRNGHERHPTWDFLRHSGDREMTRILAEVGVERRQIGHPWDGDFQERPTDVIAFRDAMIAAHPENEERWRTLADILADPDWWIYFGY